MIKYGAAIFITIILGLASRRFTDQIPAFVAEHAGDMLWASMVYFGFRMIGTSRSLSLAAALSILFSFSIEFSQLYQAPWMVELRSTSIGSLVLGRGFLWVDLVRYVIGIALAYSVDKLWLHVRGR